MFLYQVYNSRKTSFSRHTCYYVCMLLFCIGTWGTDRLDKSYKVFGYSYPFFDLKPETLVFWFFRFFFIFSNFQTIFEILLNSIFSFRFYDSFLLSGYFHFPSQNWPHFVVNFSLSCLICNIESSEASQVLYLNFWIFESLSSWIID